MKQSVRCPRCGRIMPYVHLLVVDSAKRLKMCHQCRYAQTAAYWSSSLFACDRIMAGRWRAVMYWRRTLGKAKYVRKYYEQREKRDA